MEVVEPPGTGERTIGSAEELLFRRRLFGEGTLGTGSARRDEEETSFNKVIPSFGPSCVAFARLLVRCLAPGFLSGPRRLGAGS